MKPPPAKLLAPATLRGAAAGLVAVAAGALLLWAFPEWEIGVFAQGAARMSGLLTGAPVFPLEDGWMLSLAGEPVLVTAACSGTGNFLMVAALLAWHAAQRGWTIPGAMLGGLAAGAPLAMVINALRVIAVVQAERWIIPRFPDGYGPLLHMLTGAAVFLPLLIGLNLALEYHARRPARPGA